MNEWMNEWMNEQVLTYINIKIMLDPSIFIVKLEWA